MSAPTHSAPIHGLLAEFDRPDALVAAAHSARAEGFSRVEAFSPMPIHELDEALGLRNKVAPAVLIGGLTGAAVGFALQYWVSVIEYPVNIGGRPWFSWPAFIVPMFETTILFAALTAVFGMLAMNGLPQPHHPLFNVERFAEATRSRFFLLVESADPKFDRQRTREFLARQKPVSVEEVPH
jgi:hypothetical protein